MDVPDLPPGTPIWITFAVGLALGLAQVVPKILGPIGTLIDEWAQRRRRAAVERDDADIADLRREIEYLAPHLANKRAEIGTRDRLIIAHLLWDHRALSTNPDLGPPPPLWPSQISDPQEDT